MYTPALKLSDMIFLSLFAAALFPLFATLALGSNITSKPFAKIQGLVKDTRFNDSIALVLGEVNEKGRIPVLTIPAAFDPSRDEDPFAQFLIKPENLVKFAWKRPVQRSIDEILADSLFSESVVRIGSNWKKVDLSEHREEFMRIAVFLWKLCGRNPGKLLDEGEIESKARVIGAWICQKYGFHGMVEVANTISFMTPEISRAWSGISVFQA